jgi:hypothetical protein
LLAGDGDPELLEQPRPRGLESLTVGLKVAVGCFTGVSRTLILSAKLAHAFAGIP